MQLTCPPRRPVRGGNCPAAMSDPAAKPELSPGRALVAGLLLAAVYFVAGKLGLKLALLHPSATAVWPPTGIALAALLLLGYRVWPGVWLGALLVNLTTSVSLPTALGIATGNTLEAVVGAWLVNRYAGGGDAFQRAPTYFRFVGLAALLSTLAGATVGVASLALGGAAPWGSLGGIWLTWWLGDMGGNLIVAPLLILWRTTPHNGWKRWRRWEVLFSLLTLVGAGEWVFGGLFPGFKDHSRLAFWCIPPLIWIAFRFGPREAAAAVFLLSGIAVWGTWTGAGPLAARATNESLLLLQLFLAVNAVMTLGLAAEVQDRRRVEESARLLNTDLHRRVKELQAVLDVLPVGVGITRDPQCRDIRVNQAFARMLEVPTERNASLSAPGVEAPANFRVLVQGRELPPAELPMQQAAAHGVEVRGLEEELVFTDGRTLHLLGYATPLRDEAGQVCGSVGAFVDITERKQTERTHAQFAALVAASDDAIISQSLDGVITSWNPGAERLFGYPAAEILGQSLRRLVPPDRANEETDRLARLARGEHLAAYETVRVRKDGQVVVVSLTLSPIQDRAGQVIGISAIARDITVLKQAEEEIRASLHEKEVMLQEIHHRVKNSLQIVSSLLRLQAASLKSPDAIAALEHSGSRVQSMALVHEMLYQSSNLSALDFAAYVQSLTASLLRSYGAEPPVIRLQFDLDPVHLDINQAIPCALILSELVTNALKYAFPAGRPGDIWILLHREPDGTTQLTVGDNGVGLPANWNPDQPTSLGLQLVASLVHQLHGKLDLRQHNGTEYAITFTAAKPGNHHPKL